MNIVYIITDTLVTPCGDWFGLRILYYNSHLQVLLLKMLYCKPGKRTWPSAGSSASTEAECIIN